MSEDIFSNCSDHYPIEKFFLNCTNTTRPCDLIHNLTVVSKLHSIFNYYITSTLFLIALVINVYFLSLTLPLYLRVNTGTRKRYVFVLSRCISSISAAATLLVLRCILYIFPPATSSSFFLYAIVLIADDISFHSLQGAYIGMAVLLYIGVIHPVYFSTRLTLRKIYLLAISNWILAAVISIPSGLLQTATYVDGPITCDSQVCGPAITLVNFIILSLTFILTISIFLFVLVCLSWHIRRAKRLDSLASCEIIQHARIRLLWTLLPILLISVADGILSIFELNLKTDNVLGTCTNFYQADRLINVTVFTSLDSIVWAVVLLVDPLANIIFDRQISAEAVKQIDLMKAYFAKIIEFLTKRL